MIMKPPLHLPLHPTLHAQRCPLSANTVILFWLILLHEHSFYLRVMSDKEKKLNYLAET